MGHIQLGDISITVEKKNIKNINLRVYPPNGDVKITAPYRVNQMTIKAFAQSKLEWIRKQQARIRKAAPVKPVILIDGETHFFNGAPYILKVLESGKPGVHLNGENIILHINSAMTLEEKQKLLDQWYREHLKRTIPGLIEKWESRMSVRVKEFGIRKMKTRWGSCNYKAGRIWINLELAKKPPECLEYVVIHEMVHLLEKSHNERFYSLLEKFYPSWRTARAMLRNHTSPD